MLFKTGIVLGCAALAAGFAARPQDLRPVEQDPVLWLLSVVVLSIGGGGLKLLYDVQKAINSNTIAVNGMAESIRTLVSQNQEAHRTYADERNRAVDEVTGSVREAESRIVREFERYKTER